MNSTEEISQPSLLRCNCPQLSYLKHQRWLIGRQNFRKNRTGKNIELHSWRKGRWEQGRTTRGKDTKRDDKGNTENGITVKKCLPPLLDQFDRQQYCLHHQTGTRLLSIYTGPKDYTRNHNSTPFIKEQTAT